MPARVVESSNLAEFADEWDALVATMAVPSPFLRSWWLSAVETDAAVFLLVVDGERLLGGLPLRRRTFPGLAFYRFAGSGTLCPDHLDVVASPEHAATVSEQLSSWARRPGNRLFDLAGVAEHSRIPSWLPGARTSELDGAPGADLPATAEEYLARRPRSFRKTVRRTRNRFDEIEASIRPAGTAELVKALDVFTDLHRARGDRAALLAELPRLRAALAAGVKAGEAWVDVLATPVGPIAVSISFAVCGRVSLYQTARSQDGASDNASTILNLAAIDRGIEAGCHEVDLLRGMESYKRHYTERTRRLFRVRGAHGALARAVLLGIGLAKRVKDASRARRASAA